MRYYCSVVLEMDWEASTISIDTVASLYTISPTPELCGQSPIHLIHCHFIPPFPELINH